MLSKFTFHLLLLSSLFPCSDAFVKAMARFGFTGLKPTDIVTTGRQIREELSQTDPQKAAALYVYVCG